MTSESLFSDDLPASGAQELIGYRILARGDGSSRVVLAVASGHLNIAGLVHGGILCTLADVAGACAILPQEGLADGVRCATLSMSIVFIEAARADHIRRGTAKRRRTQHQICRSRHLQRRRGATRPRQRRFQGFSQGSADLSAAAVRARVIWYASQARSRTTLASDANRIAP